MKKNAKPKMALKLMQLCKYFQHQEFPYFVVKSLFGKQQFGWQYQALNRKKGVFGGPYQTIDLKSLDKKLWITEELSLLHWEDTLETILIDSVLPKLGVCDFQFLSLNFQNITFKQFKILTASGNVTVLSLRNALIRDKNGDNVPLEDILEILPKIQELILYENFII
uniref:Uncharacterized protein n=1 Tax=Panagrolaimus sp. ES5 TaxID=591445 RepID=A0AC34FLH2_9BILA